MELNSDNSQNLAPKLRFLWNKRNMTIYVPFENRNEMIKFIDERLYPHLYNLYPDLFEQVVEIEKTTTPDDLPINDNTDESNITE